MVMRHGRLLLAAWVAVVMASAAWGQEMPKPGPEHEMLKELAGTWDAAIKMGGQEAKGTAVYKMELGGFWLMSTFEGDLGGMKFKGQGIDGYDPLRKKFVTTWVDSMSPTPLWMEGTYDKETHTMTMTGEGAGQDGKLHKYKTTTETKGKDAMVFKMFEVKDGKDNEMMSITYTRTK
jgi:hypothetical protein